MFYVYFTSKDTKDTKLFIQQRIEQTYYFRVFRVFRCSMFCFTSKNTKDTKLFIQQRIKYFRVFRIFRCSIISIHVIRVIRVQIRTRPFCGIDVSDFSCEGRVVCEGFSHYLIIKALKSHILFAKNRVSRKKVVSLPRKWGSMLHFQS